MTSALPFFTFVPLLTSNVVGEHVKFQLKPNRSPDVVELLSEALCGVRNGRQYRSTARVNRLFNRRTNTVTVSFVVDELDADAELYYVIYANG